jgi:hypothetical protein
VRPIFFAAIPHRGAQCSIYTDFGPRYSVRCIVRQLVSFRSMNHPNSDEPRPNSGESSAAGAPRLDTGWEASARGGGPGQRVTVGDRRASSSRGRRAAEGGRPSVGGGERGRSGKALCEEEGREKKKKYSLYEGICFFLSLTIGNLFCYLTFRDENCRCSLLHPCYAVRLNGVSARVALRRWQNGLRTK